MKNQIAKHPLVLALIAAVCFSLTGCGIEDELPVITFTVQSATQIALHKQSPKTKADVYNISAALRALSSGPIPTSDAVHKAIATYTTDPEAAAIGDLVAETYGKYYSKLNGDDKVAADLLEAIAQGIENGAGN
jgi:hypothetical protein